MFRLFASLLFLASFGFAETADWIFTARYVVTMDGARRLINDGAVAVRGERIVGVGSRVSIERRFEATQRVDRPQAILMPGLINTHAHAAMSLLRGVADDVPLQEWLEKYIFPAEARNVTPEFVRWGTKLACLEMMLSGTTTFVDMYYYEDVAAEATKEAGLRGVLGETVLKFPAPDFKTPAATLEFTEKFIRRFEHDPLIVPTVAPHAIYTNTDATLKGARALANRYGVPMIIHVSETERENTDSQREHHATPTAYLESIGALHGRTLFAHGVWLTDADLDLVKTRGIGIAHCPSSNMKLASGIAPVVKMLAMGIPVGLGTDGPAGSNNDFDMLEEMDLAAKLQKVTLRDPRVLPAGEAIAMATISGARAIGMENEIGSIETGKRADFITLRLDRPNAVPLYNVYSQIVYALKGCDVEDVIVNGRPVVRDGRSLTVDSRQVFAKANELAAKVKATLRAR